MHTISEEIIIRAIQKKASSEELDILNNWIRKDKKNASFFFQLEEVWESKNYISKEEINSGWEMITKKIESRQRKEESSTYPPKTSIAIWTRYVAAIFVGILISTTLWLNSSKHNKPLDTEVIVQNTIYNKSGVHHITLPDNSEVWLNNESEISYLETFAKNRKVELKGKAYFDIKNHNNSPFIVQMGSTEIEVLGTEFFVESISEEKQTITLISGSINLHHSDSYENKTTASLTPGEQAVIDNINTSIEINSINTDYYVAFKNGTYRFTDEPIEKIIPILAKHYNLEIKIEPSIRDKRFTGRVIQDQNIESVLNSIAKSYPIKYKKSSNHIYIYE